MSTLPKPVATMRSKAKVAARTMPAQAVSYTRWRLPAILAVSAFLMTVATVIVWLGFTSEPELQPTATAEDKPAPRYTLNPAGGKPTSANATAPADTTNPAATPSNLEANAGGGADATKPAATSPAAEPPAVAKAPTRPAKLPKPTNVADTPTPALEKPAAAVDASAAPRTVKAAAQPRQEAPKKVQEEETSSAVDAPLPQEAPRKSAPERLTTPRYDNPWDTPSDSGFNQK